MFVDTFDVYLPALVLPAAMSYFLPHSMSPSASVTVSTLLFCVSLLGRPIGGLVFGNLSDKIGRKRVTLISAGGFTACTLLISVLPGYGSWGVAVILVFALLRLVNGIFLGGGYAAPIPLALEHSPARLRGLVGGLIAAAAPAAFLVISLIQVLALRKLPKADFLSWGWRLPFFLGVLLGIGYLVHYLRVDEGNESYWAARRAERRQPVRELFSRRNAKTLGQVFLLTSGYWFAAQMAVSLLPSLLTGDLHQDATNVSLLTLAGSVFTIFSVIGFAVLGQRVGRRKVLLGAACAITVVTALTFALMVHFAEVRTGFFAVAVMGIIANALTSGPLGVLITYLNERFPLSVRSTGYSVGYTFGLILPGLYSVWLLGLGNLMPYAYGPVVLIVLGGLLMTFAVHSGPETTQIDSLTGEARTVERELRP
ncbi:MHS family MFS transporter [Amycolatopsis alkalitolerans]|uniref:MHS family MFS transporter n=2 Tax=Amycolatopsis alkalitolerans TaxID=2547244 RepID=A0A5C4LWY2_9PSEU|nr:MHS family MFS transporter [Amycolatopsis alkalitolerans]